jgi:UDP-N-acetylmuramoyl-L-alanyl-D-glutamate--2,6-diaminopimelate ligase
MLAALATGLAVGLEFDEIARGIETARQVPGRFEIVRPERAQDNPPFLVVVDYAHTEDALKNVLETARGLNPTRLVTVFGCGGDRDRTKRAPMGEVAGTLSDFVIVTSDNPRSEDPEAIIEESVIGLKRTGTRYLTIPDRREAIFRAIEEAQADDIVIVAGKGHETYQVFKDRTAHFDDREVAREALATVGITNEA